MTDIALIQDPDTGLWDIDLAGPDLKADNGLQTAVVLSLICDGLASVDDEITDGTNDRRGWWADAYAEVDGDQWGSLDWLLRREKQVAPIPARAAESAQNALQWMIDDGIAAAIDVNAKWIKQGWLERTIVIMKPDGSSSTFRFGTFWRSI